MLSKKQIEALVNEYFDEGESEKSFSKTELEAFCQRVDQVGRESQPPDSNVFLENLLNYLPDTIYFKGLESEFIKVNRTMAASHGFSDPDELVGKTDFDLFPHNIAVQKFADEQNVMQQDAPAIKDELNEFEDGRMQWVSSTKLPLKSSDGKTIGTFGISRDVTDRKLAEDRMQKTALELQEINEQTANDLEMAHKVQMAFIPKSYPSFTWDLSSNESALNFFHRYIPSETLAGDFFQVIPISNSQAGVIVCDVMGHGVRASLVTAVLRGLVGELKLITPYPHVFLGKVNRSLNSVLKQLDGMMFVTAFYGVFDLIKGQFRYANAGHPLPVVVNRKDQKSHYLDPVSDNPEPALGLVDNFRYTSATRKINPGDSYIFYTDGIVEVEDDYREEFGKDRLLMSLSHPEMKTSDEILDALLTDVEQYSLGKELMDDMCAVSVDVVRIAQNHAG